MQLLPGASYAADDQANPAWLYALKGGLKALGSNLLMVPITCPVPACYMELSGVIRKFLDFMRLLNSSGTYE